MFDLIAQKESHLYKAIVAFLLVAVILISPLLIAAYAQVPKVPVVILFKEKPTDQDVNFLKANGGEITRTYTIINGFAANVPQDKLDVLRSNPRIISVDPDVDVKALDLSADTQIRADQVWGAGDTGQAVPVAILDTGIDTTHPEFAGRILKCHSEISNPSTCDDQNGHGTHVAGIAGAAGVNPSAKGVAPALSFYIDQVLNAGGSGKLSGIIAGIDWSVSNGAKVVSMSLGTSPISTTEPNCDTAFPSLTTAVNNAVSAGLTVVAAAGNSGTNGVGAPACISSTIAAGAVDSSDTIASFSSQGGPMADHGISAPGVNIFSTWLSGGYATLSGTSMATPMVSGTIALLLKASPGLSHATIRSTLFSTACTSTTTPSCPTGIVPNTVYGYGIVDALRAYSAVAAPPTPDFSISASLSALTIQAGGSGSSTITVRSLNGFSGTVSLAASAPAGLTPTLSSTSLPLTSGGSASSTLSVAVSSSTTAGTYIVTVAGTSGSLSHSTTVTVTVQTVPSAPQNLVATAGNAQVTLSWSAPLSDGGSAITNYKIYRGTASGLETLFTTIGNVLSYTDTTVTNGQAYFYQVTAVNSVGESTKSNEASATPSASVPTLHVKSITTFTEASGTSGNIKIGTQVTIVDSSTGNGVQGATVSIIVTITSTGGTTTTLTGSGVTDALGIVTIVVGPTKQKGTYTSCVDNVVLTGWAFDGIKPCASGTLT